MGAYTYSQGKGINAYRFETSTGKVDYLGLVAEAPHPAFLAVHPNRRFLYAANEHDAKGVGQGQHGQRLRHRQENRKAGLTEHGFRAGRGSLLLVRGQDRGRTFFWRTTVAEDVAVLPISPRRLREATAFVQHQGSSVNPQRQQGPHAHSIILSPDNRFALAADLGLDQVRVYRFDASAGSLVPNQPPFVKISPGTGPRHLVFHPNGKFLYAVSEMGSSVFVFAYDAAGGSLRELQTISALPPGYIGQSTSAELQVDRAGRFLYASNRGHDSIVVFAIDPATRAPLAPDPARTLPRGKLAALFRAGPHRHVSYSWETRSSNNIVLFRVDRNTGRLTPTGRVLEESPGADLPRVRPGEVSAYGVILPRITGAAGAGGRGQIGRAPAPGFVTQNGEGNGFLGVDVDAEFRRGGDGHLRQ